MTRRARITVLAGLAIVALVGLVAIVEMTRPEPALTPDQVGAERLADLTYRGDVSAPDGANTLDVYLPPLRLDREPVPAVIWIHGGGWINGDKRETMPVWNWTDRGVAVVAVNYRLAEGGVVLADTAADIDAAVDHVLDHASDWGIDVTRIAVYGHSAGGHLAALVAVSDAPVAAVVAAGAPLDLQALVDPTLESFVGLVGADAPRFTADVLGCQSLDVECDRLAASFSPAAMDLDETQLFIIHGDADPLVPVDQALQFERVHGNEDTVRTEIVEGAGHVPFGPEAFDFLRPALGL